MSRIGNQPVNVPSDVRATLKPGSVVVKGPKGELTLGIPASISVSQKGEDLIVSRKGDHRFIRGTHGAFRAHLENAIVGVTRGWTKTLELSGVGFRANLSGSDLILTVGFSHPVTIKPAGGISFAVSEGKIVVSGINRHVVGQAASDIRAVKPPEPYKGKGIKYAGEHIRKKAGKAKAVGGAPGATK